KRFGGDRSAIGKVVQINNTAVTIVGVIPPEFTGIQQAVGTAPDVTLPLSLDTQLGGNAFGDGKPRMMDPSSWWLQLMGRLKPGATSAQVRGNLEGIFRDSARQGFESYMADLKEEERSASRNRNRTEIPQLRADSGSRGIYDVNTNDTRSATIL